MAEDHRNRLIGWNHSDAKKAGITDYTTIRVPNDYGLPPGVRTAWSGSQRMYRTTRPTDTTVRFLDFSNSADADPRVYWNYNPNKPRARVDLEKKLDIDKRIIENPDYAMISLSDNGPDYHGIKLVR